MRDKDNSQRSKQFKGYWSIYFNQGLNGLEAKYSDDNFPVPHCTRQVVPNRRLYSDMLIGLESVPNACTLSATCVSQSRFLHVVSYNGYLPYKQHLQVSINGLKAQISFTSVLFC